MWQTVDLTFPITRNMSRLEWPIIKNLDISSGTFLSNHHLDNTMFALGEILSKVEGCFHDYFRGQELHIVISIQNAPISLERLVCYEFITIIKVH